MLASHAKKLSVSFFLALLASRTKNSRPRVGLRRSAESWLVAEILGGIGAQLIIKAAITGRGVTGHQALRIGCDNMGVVRHGNSPLWPMLEQQPQADVLRYYKGLMASSRIRGKMEHVYGHSDEYLSETEMSHDQRINCRADKLATSALVAAINTTQYIISIFPSERVCVEIAGTRVTGSPKSAISELCVDPLIPGHGQTIPRSVSFTRQHHLNVARESSWLS